MTQVSRHYDEDDRLRKDLARNSPHSELRLRSIVATTRR